MNLSTLLAQCITFGASDLHLSSGVPPLLRLHGDLVPLTDVALTHDVLHAALMATLPSALQLALTQTHACDFL